MMRLMDTGSTLTVMKMTLPLLSNLQWSPGGNTTPSGYSQKSDTSSSTLCHTNPIPVLPTDILDPSALISIDVMLVSPNCPTLEEDDELKIVNIQFNSLDVIANQETIIALIGFVRSFPSWADSSAAPVLSVSSLELTQLVSA